jgi:ABC-type oligopeptide transport system substrate-binding subunit
MNKKFVLSVLVVLATLTLAACAPSTSSLSPEKGAAYAAKVDDIVENLIIGVSENDYAKYTRDMDEDFLKNYGSSFQGMAEEISSEFGAYLSKTLDHVEGQQLRRTVVYHLAFENKPDVLLKVTFSIFDSKHIQGTYWNSE